MKALQTAPSHTQPTKNISTMMTATPIQSPLRPGMQASNSSLMSSQTVKNFTFATTETLCALPAEVIENITQRLPLGAVSSLRLVCKDLEAKAFRHFSRAFFKVITTDLAVASLQDLKAISEHKNLKNCVEVLCLTEIVRGDPGVGFKWKRYSSGSLVCPDPATKILGDILIKNLVNCRSFSLVPYASTYKHDLDLPFDAFLPADHLEILFETIKETGLTVEKLQFSIDHQQFEGDEQEEQEEAYRQRFLNPRLLHVWAGLKELSLQHNNCREECVYWMAEIVARAAGLQKLKLDFVGTDGTICDIFIEELEHLSSSKTLPSLLELELFNFHMDDESSLCWLLSCFDHRLQTLKIAHSGLHPERSWPAVFKDLQNEVPVLEKFDVSYLQLYYDYRLSPLGGEAQAITFNALKDDETFQNDIGKNLQLVELNGNVAGVRYEGPKMREALDMIFGGIGTHPFDRDIDIPQHSE